MDRSDCTSPEAASSSAGADATLLMLLLEASTEIEPKCAETEPLTPVDSLLPPHSSTTGVQAPTPSTRNHTQELLSGRGVNAASGLPSWTSPSPVVGRGGKTRPPSHTPFPNNPAPCSRAPCF